MGVQFAETLKRLRNERGLAQREMANKLYVSRPTVARWESGNRLPDITMITRLAECLDVDVSILLAAMEESDESPNIIMVDDRKITLAGGIPVLEDVFPNATVVGFTRPSEAIEFAKSNRVSLAFLDIELGKLSGLDLCRALLEINSRTNVIFLTAHGDYSLDAWGTGASGFMLKPLTPDLVRAELKNLRHPFSF